MAESPEVELVVQPLHRGLLDGVDDGTGPQPVDLAVLPWFEDERPLQGLAGLVDWRMAGTLSGLIRDGFCCGSAGESVLLPGSRTLPIRRLVLLGLGPSSAFDRDAAERTGERLVAMVRQLAATDAIVAMPGRVSDRVVVEAVFDGLTRALAGPVTEAAARPKAVGDEEPIGVEPGEGGSRVGAASPRDPSRPSEERAPLEVAREPDFEPEPEADDAAPEAEGAEAMADSAPTPATARLAEPADEPQPAEPSWLRIWVVADPRHEARLHRLLEGPPRAAEPGT